MEGKYYNGIDRRNLWLINQICLTASSGSAFLIRGAIIYYLPLIGSYVLFAIERKTFSDLPGSLTFMQVHLFRKGHDARAGLLSRSL